MNLFDVTPGFQTFYGPRGKEKRNDKARPATKQEMKAYLIWLADQRGVWLPHDAEYCLDGVHSKSAGGIVLEMPGYGQDQRVTMETLDDAGEVVASQTLPVEPKKGGVIWDKAAVRKACGPVDKPAKGKRAKVADPIPVAAPEPVTIADELPAPVAAAVETQEALAPTCDKPEPAIAPTAAPAVDIDAIIARLDALEQALATLSAVSVDDREITTSPVAVTEAASCDHLPKRTPAHERAIRRAWAERKARRAAESANADWEALQHRTWEQAMGHKVARRRAVIDARKRIAYWRNLSRMWQQSSAEYHGHLERDMDKRIATAQRARRMIAAARAQIDLKTRALDITNATVARLKSSAVPASEIARLEQERDVAQTALAAMVARAERAEQGIETMGERFASLVGRLSKAEAALQERAA